MARPREFDPKAALQTAIDLFWEKGYFDSSVDELVKRSGVAKYGIYGTFGTKQELFKKVLSEYTENRRHFILQILGTSDASLPEIKALLKEAARQVTRKTEPAGCLIVNTGIELGLREPEIGKFVNNFFRDIGKLFEACLKRAAEKGEVAKSIDFAKVSTYLAMEFRTALMMARSGYSRREIERHLEVALQVIE